MYSERGRYVLNIYIYMDTTTDHFTPLTLRVRGNDDTYRRNSATSSWSNRGRCALNIEILDLLNEESFSGGSSGSASL